MSDPAQITVTTGPDRGRVFELADEVMHIGRGPENDIVLSDPSLAEHQASIVSRGGRYAIFSPEEDAVQVDENAIPSDQWVWLPEEARISIGERTVVQFRSAAVLAGPASAAPATGFATSVTSVEDNPPVHTHSTRSIATNGAALSSWVGPNQ